MGDDGVRRRANWVDRLDGQEQREGVAVHRFLIIANTKSISTTSDYDMLVPNNLLGLITVAQPRTFLWPGSALTTTCRIDIVYGL